MKKGLRYGLVALFGASAIAAVFLITAVRTADKNEYQEETDPKIGIQDYSYDGVGDGEETMESYDVSFYEPSELSSEETDVFEETSRETEDPEEETAGETATEEEKYFGLRAYFKNKLVLDAEKVHLYLNVREAPDDDSEILAILLPGEVREYIGKSGHWYEIQCDGFTGYVSEDYVLTDMDAYEATVDTVAYAAMAEHDSTYMYAEPDDTGTIILAAAKSDVFRLVGTSGDYYQVRVVSELYDTLYVHMDDVLIFYLFLGYGNDNELSDAYEAYFGNLEISDNIEKSERIKEEAEEEVAEWRSADASSREEQSSIEQAYIDASKAAAAESKAAARREASRAVSEAQASGQAQYMGRFLVTGYCHCTVCCGIWGSDDPNYAAHGSSGMLLQDHYSVAVDSSQIPLGTKLLINGKEYIAADTGVGAGVIDIYCQTHEAALSCGASYADVYIIP